MRRSLDKLEMTGMRQKDIRQDDLEKRTLNRPMIWGARYVLNMGTVIGIVTNDEISHAVLHSFPRFFDYAQNDSGKPALLELGGTYWAIGL